MLLAGARSRACLLGAHAKALQPIEPINALRVTVSDKRASRVLNRMRRLLPILVLATACTASRPPLPPPPPPRFTIAALQQKDPELCRAMAEWDCEGLDCPDCKAQEKSARKQDLVEGIAATALSLVAKAPPAPPPGPNYADALSSGESLVPTNGGYVIRAESVVEACQVTCGRCETTRKLCDR